MNQKRSYPFYLLTDYFCNYNKITEDTPYEIIEIDAKELFTANRIDLAAKYCYIESIETGQNKEFAKELYIKHIEAFTDGTNKEAGNLNKDSITSYLEAFDQLIAEVKEKGFDSNISFIPVGSQKELFDGAHRTACAAYFGKKVTIVLFPHLSVCYDYHFFRKRLLDEVYIEYMAEKMCMIKKDIRCLCVWPSVSLKKNLLEIRKALKDANLPIVYCKKRKVNLEEFKKIIARVYEGESWVGNKWNHYRGAAKKAELCFGKGDTITMYLVQCSNVEKLTALKEKIRDIFALEKHSVHSTDTKEQTINLVKILSMRSSTEENSNQYSNINLWKKFGRKIRYFYAVLIYKIKCIIGKPV